MPLKKCSVANCNILMPPFHPFPKKNIIPGRLDVWLEACGNPSLYTIDEKKLHCQYFVCHHHFEEKFITRNGRLVKIAVPTINLPSKIKTGNIRTNTKPHSLEDSSSVNTSSSFSSIKADAEELIENVILSPSYSVVKNVFSSNVKPLAGTQPNTKITNNSGSVNKENMQVVKNILSPNVKPLAGTQPNTKIFDNSGSVNKKNMQEDNDRSTEKHSKMDSHQKNVRLNKQSPSYLMVTKDGLYPYKITRGNVGKNTTGRASGATREWVSYRHLKAIPGIIKRRNQIKKSLPERNRKCTCTIHCCRRNALRQTVVNADISTRLEGSLLKWDPSDNSILSSNPENIFSISTILTNINDKTQIEQLCQILIESIFKLKNLNLDDTMGTLTIYLTHNTRHCTETNKNVDEMVHSSVKISNNLSSEQTNLTEKASVSNTNDENTLQSTNSSTIVKQLENIVPHSQAKTMTKHVKANLNAFHDHSYLSCQSNILFQKPNFLVNLINIDTYKTSKKKSRILTPLKKSLNERRIIRLQEALKKKNENIKFMSEKIKFLGAMVQEEKGIKRLKFPKTKDSVPSITEINNSAHKDNNFDVNKNNPSKKLNPISDVQLSQEVRSPDFDISLDTDDNQRYQNLISDIVKGTISERFGQFHESFVEECIVETCEN